jgi:hypothetical protein
MILDTIKAIHNKIPLIIKKTAFICGLLSSALGSYGLISQDNFFIKTGGVCLMISVALPPLFGVKKDENTDSK